MGGPGASDDLALTLVTQTWLAATEAPTPLLSGGHWHHRRTEQLHAAVHDEAFQDALPAGGGSGLGDRTETNA